MSHKRYRNPAPSIVAEAAPEAAPQVLTPEDAALVETVKEFLGKVIRRACEMLDEIPRHQGEQGVDRTIRIELRNQVGAVARLGIAACRALVQALRLTGADTGRMRKLIDETVSNLRRRIQKEEENLAQRQPVAA